MEKFKNKTGEEAHSSLNEEINRLETTLNHLTEELHKLKERKLLIENKSRYAATNSLVGTDYPLNNETKNKSCINLEYKSSVALETTKSKNKKRKHEETDSEEPNEDIALCEVDSSKKCKKKKKSKNKTNIFLNLDDLDLKERLYLIQKLVNSVSELTDNNTNKEQSNNYEKSQNDPHKLEVRYEETAEPKKKKKHKNRAENDNKNMDNTDVNENSSIYQNGLPKKSKKKKNNDDAETYCSGEIEKSKSNKKVKVNSFTNFDKEHLTERLNVIKNMVTSITEQTSDNKELIQENYSKNPQKLHNEFVLPPAKCIPNSEPGPSNFATQPIQLFQNNGIPNNSNNVHRPSMNHLKNDRFHYNNTSIDYNALLAEYVAYKDTVRYSDKIPWKKERKQLIEKIKTHVIKLDFKGSNINQLPGYGEWVYKL